tara:strand:- start:1576 stop:1818 length:243 start_codon:yes stop_codon:yes gene_type:complete
MSQTSEAELRAAMEAIDWENTTDVECSKCGSTVFIQAYQVKRLSKLVSPTGGELIIPMATFVCQKCGHIDKALQMNPSQI